MTQGQPRDDFPSDLCVVKHAMDVPASFAELVEVMLPVRSLLEQQAVMSVAND